MICIERLSFSYGRQSFIEELSCELADGRIPALIGPNGSGKSTLLRLCAGLLRPTAGNVMVNGSNLRSYSSKELARELGQRCRDKGGARALRRLVQETVEGPLAMYLLETGRHPSCICGELINGSLCFQSK